MTKVKPVKVNQEDWINKKWRPMMAIMYMTVCIFDFIIFPIGFTIVQFWETQANNDAFRQWQPLTLIGAGLFHMAMGAVLGITAWSRGQEKMAGATNSYMNNSSSMPYGIGGNMQSWGTSSNNYPTSTQQYWSPAPTSSPVQFSASGKAMVPQDFPER